MPMSTGSGEIVKMEVDYSVTCDETLPGLIKMAKEGNLTQALVELLALEKQTRTVRQGSTSLFMIYESEGALQINEL